MHFAAVAPPGGFLLNIKTTTMERKPLSKRKIKYIARLVLGSAAVHFSSEFEGLTDEEEERVHAEIMALGDELLRGKPAYESVNDIVNDVVTISK